MKARAGDRVEGKAEFHVITPEGREVYFGHYASTAAATRAFNKHFAADWRQLAYLVESELETSGFNNRHED